MATKPTTNTELITLIRESGILQPSALDAELSRLRSLPPDPHRAATVLVQQGLLTHFQASQLLTGRAKSFRLGAYILRDLIGQGGMGTVFLADHPALRRRVAIKVLNAPSEGEDVEIAVERFLREARSAAALDHPNIVRIYDVGRQKNIHYLGMEYGDGESLEQRLKKGGPITPSRAVDYIAQAAAGLQHADERGFVHRDIKPANLILTKDEKTLKILDMGLARSFSITDDKLTEKFNEGAIVGTVDFISPEQSLGCDKIDIRSDIYSLGATFFTLLTGRPPFEGNTAQKLAQHQMKPPPDLAALDPTLPKGLAAVVAKMLAKKPHDRYQAPSDVIAALTPWLGGSRTNVGGRNAPPEPRAVGTDLAVTEPLTEAELPPVKRPAVNRRTIGWAALVLGVLLVGVVGGVLASGGSRPAPVMPASSDPPAVAAAPAEPLANAPPPVAPTPKKDPEIGPLWRLDLSQQKEFRRRGTLKYTGMVGRGVRLEVTEKSGDGTFPEGWSGTTYDPEGIAEFTAIRMQKDGLFAFGMRNIEKNNVNIVSPDTILKQSKCRLVMEYRTDSSEPIHLSFGALDPYPPERSYVLLGELPGTTQNWRTVEMVVDTKHISRGCFGVSWRDPDPENWCWFRRFEAYDVVTPR